MRASCNNGSNLVNSDFATGKNTAKQALAKPTGLQRRFLKYSHKLSHFQSPLVLYSARRVKRSVGRPLVQVVEYEEEENANIH